MAQYETLTVSLPERVSIPVKAQKIDIAYPRWFGGTASCVAVVVSHPLDLSKYSTTEPMGRVWMRC
jgi:dicarboxylate transporter 10